MSKRFSHRAMSLVAALALVLAPFASSVTLAAPTATAPQAPTTKPTADKVIFFAADGMRPDKVESYAAQGYMPTHQQIISDGVKGDNGLLQGFPPNTGVGWYTLASGTWPGEHGSTNNTFFRAGDTFTNRTSFATTGILQADTIQQAAERAGKKIVSVEWVGSRNITPTLSGPVIDFRSFFSTRGVLAYPLDVAQQTGAATFGVSYTVASFITATGWISAPVGDLTVTPMEVTMTVLSTFAAQNPTRDYNLYIYDSVDDATDAYDKVLMLSAGLSKTVPVSPTILSVNDWADIKLVGADGLIGTRAGQTAGFYTKLITLTADLSAFKIYFTSVTRANASCGCDPNFESTLADMFPTSTAGDFAPLEAGIIDEDTYAEQGLKWKDFHWPALNYILTTVQTDTNLLLLGNPVTDEFQHQFLALVTPTDIDGNPNPYYDDVENNDIPDNRIAEREGYIRSAYEEADATLGLGLSLMGSNTAVFSSSDHGFAPQWYAVNARKVLSDTTVTFTSTPVSLHPSGASSTSNCSASASTDYVKACWAGGTAQFYLNPALAPAGSVTATTVISAVINAFTVLTDTANPTATVVSPGGILTKTQLRNVQGSDSLHPNRSGDVVVVLRPPYQYDAASLSATIAFSQFFGQHGYFPDLVDLANNVNMHGSFFASGTGILSATTVSNVRAIDVAPTVAFLMGIPGPQNARGNILYDMFTDGGDWEEISLLNISDYHGQLIPVTENPDSLSGTPTQAIGGAAYLKPWLDTYEAEMGSDLTIRLAGGDSVGATPPISAFFEDTPTIDAMNLMLFDYDGLGNHNFDRGQLHLRENLIPRSNYKYLSANLVFPTVFMPVLANNSSSTTVYGLVPNLNLNALASPPGFGYGWEPSVMLSTSSGSLIGLLGYSNDDLPLLTSPAAVAPVRVTSSTVAVQNEANRLIAQGAEAVIAFGHLGAVAGGISTPTGPLIDLADAVSGVDLIIGDHSNFQVISQRANGTLVTENLSRGIRITRIKLVLDTTTNAVIYKTADFHRPWNIGVTADSAILTMIDDLNAQLGPIFSTIIGNSGVYIPRADSCGRADGRLCESLVGNLTTDAMRLAYAVDFAITNSGGLRADLTCPTTDIGTDYCPAYVPPPHPISRGQVLAVLPFGNYVVTLQVNGAELKSMLENGFSQMPNANGRYPQVSGMCVSYEISNTVGTRVLSATTQLPNGSCGGPAVDFTTAITYTIAENDFMVNGGDGYPNFYSRSVSQNIMDQVLADHITALGTFTPTIQGRIACYAGGVLNALPCPQPLP